METINLGLFSRNIIINSTQEEHSLVGIIEDSKSCSIKIFNIKSTDSKSIRLEELSKKYQSLPENIKKFFTFDVNSNSSKEFWQREVMNYSVLGQELEIVLDYLVDLFSILNDLDFDSTDESLLFKENFKKFCFKTISVLKMAIVEIDFEGNFDSSNLNELFQIFRSLEKIINKRM